MSYVNLLVFESLFRVRNDMGKFKPAVLAHLSVHGKMPSRNTVANGALRNRLFGTKLYDYNLDPEWIQNLNSSELINGEFNVSGGFDRDNVSFISFDKVLTPKVKAKLDKLKSIPQTYIHIDKSHYLIPKIVISSPYFYDKESMDDNKDWRTWWDNITAALKDM